MMRIFSVRNLNHSVSCGWNLCSLARWWIVKLYGSFHTLFLMSSGRSSKPVTSHRMSSIEWGGKMNIWIIIQKKNLRQCCSRFAFKCYYTKLMHTTLHMCCVHLMTLRNLLEPQNWIHFFFKLTLSSKSQALTACLFNFVKCSRHEGCVRMLGAGTASPSVFKYVRSCLA